MNVLTRKDIHEPLAVCYDTQIDCVLATVMGEISRKLVADFYTEIGRVADENKCTRVLTDLRNAKAAITSFDLYFEITDLNRKKILETFKRAVVIARDEELFAFWENASINLGYENVKVFRDYDAALKWVVM